MKEDTKKLLEIANEDLEISRELFKNKRYRIVTFLCQQAVEKFLKAYLIENKGEYPITHSIAFLIKSCAEIDKDFEYLFKINTQELSKYYTVTRYLPLMDITESDAKEAIDIAEKVKDFILRKLKIGWSK